MDGMGVGACAHVFAVLHHSVCLGCFCEYLDVEIYDTKMKKAPEEWNKFVVCFKKVLKIILPLGFLSHLFNDMNEYTVIKTSIQSHQII